MDRVLVFEDGLVISLNKEGFRITVYDDNLTVSAVVGTIQDSVFIKDPKLFLRDVIRSCHEDEYRSMIRRTNNGKYFMFIFVEPVDSDFYDLQIIMKIPEQLLEKAIELARKICDIKRDNYLKEIIELAGEVNDSG